MSCRGCAIPIDCLGLDGNPSSDIAPSFGFFATQDYSFTLDCPAGYLCMPGRNPVKIIPGTIIPPITTDGGIMCIQGCLSMVCVTPLPNASQSDLQGLANFLFFEWAQQQAACNNRQKPQAPGLPPPILVGGRGSQIDIFNAQQCFTAHCVPENSGTPQTVCIPPGTFGTTLLDPTPSSTATLQAQMDSLASGAAEQQAKAKLGCGVCNAFLHDFRTCPGDPGKVASVTIDPNTYCLPLPHTQFEVDAMASVALNNQITAILKGLGCVCPGPTIAPDGTITSPCDIHTTWNLNSPLNIVIGVGGFNPLAQFKAFNGCNISSPELHSIINTSPSIQQFFPSQPC